MEVTKLGLKNMQIRILSCIRARAYINIRETTINSETKRKVPSFHLTQLRAFINNSEMKEKIVGKKKPFSTKKKKTSRIKMTGSPVQVIISYRQD